MRLKTDSQKEVFQPIRNDAPVNLSSKIKFSFRLLLDFQTLTLYKDLKSFLDGKKGTILDIGCGDCPYEHLVDKKSKYIGIDIKNQTDFGYRNKKIKYFNGYDIPLEDQSVDFFICTEVLEHVQRPEKLISEMRRILKKSGYGLVSIPWSARYHYIPYDYYRYTPSALETLFKQFKNFEVWNRGTDIVVICSKIIVLFAGLTSSCKGLKAILLPILLLLEVPILLVFILIGHLSLILSLGSKNDPLGYTIIVSK